MFLWSLVQTAAWVQPTAPPRNPGGAHQSVFLSFCFVKKIAIFPCPFSWPLMMASPPTPGPREQRCPREEGSGYWAVVGRVTPQASGHALYWMPRKRHMAKIMAKSCIESRSWQVRPGPQPPTGPPTLKGRG